MRKSVAAARAPMSATSRRRGRHVAAASTAAVRMTARASGASEKRSSCLSTPAGQLARAANAAVAAAAIVRPAAELAAVAAAPVQLRRLD